jgi:hypothetical protein
MGYLWDKDPVGNQKSEPTIKDRMLRCNIAQQCSQQSIVRRTIHS